ncbi:hypothetical protein RFI_11582 [Reticulomyxa filosa]|uniref:Uncharacterized protein n=1 Tax=Reticulomyxa filosa TaxID=46433 RepID=X6NGW2_RETFI|nr:hypothetical protein RFI_11582 [Reticulomyxa filosa]|eukprot:ETO25555.1 hypothetical protein RFI_11582 [Reticulomyxa filosa]
MKSNFGKIYEYFPETWIFPSQYSEFVSMTKANKEGDNDENNDRTNTNTDETNGTSDRIWIAKPCCGRRGKDITIFKNITEFACKQSPLLVGGYKFDLRMKKNNNTKKSDIYKIDDLANHYVHLTNTSLNKWSGTFGLEKEVIGSGSKWTLSKLWEYLKTEKKIDVDELWKRICEISILTFLPIVKDVQQSNNCFELFGFDILIDGNKEFFFL